MRLIDIDAAIKAVEKSMYENPHKNGICRSMHEHEHRHFLTILMGLPPAEPEYCDKNAIIQKLNEMDRYVSTELRLCDTDKKFPQNEVFIVDDVYEIIEQLPPVQPEQRWIPVTEESVIQAGYEGKEVRFRLRGRLFAIRELAQ